MRVCSPSERGGSPWPEWAVGSRGPCPAQGAPVPPAQQEDPSLRGPGCCLGAGHGARGPLPFPTPLCAPLWSGEDREPELNLFPSSATVPFPRMSQSPCGQRPLPAGSPRCLSLLSHPPGAWSRRIPTRGTPRAARPRSCQPRGPPQVHGRWQGVGGTRLPCS